MPWKTLHQIYYSRPDKIWRATWIVMAPDAKPVGQKHAMLLYDLATTLEYATHELLVFAVDPAYSISDGIDIPSFPTECLLLPAIHGYRFKAQSNKNALARILMVVRDIEQGNLSPSGDATLHWDKIFIDGVSLKAEDDSRDQ